MRPLISVLMCYRNEDPVLLKEAIDSILTQTYKDLELVLVDDASTKKYDFLESYLKNSQIRYLKNEANIGLTKSLNKGLALAKGKYIARLDSDDISFSNRLEVQVQFLESHPNYVLVGSRFLVSEKGKEYEPVDSRELDTLEIKKMISAQNFTAHSTILVRTENLRKVGGYNEFYYYAQDYELYLRLLKEGEIKVLDQVLVKRNILEGAISLKKRKEQRFYALLIMSRGFLTYGGGFSFFKNFIKGLIVILIPSRLLEFIKNLPYLNFQR